MAFSLKDTFREEILAMEGYTGGEQTNDNSIRLNTNENPYSVPRIITDAIKDEIDKNQLSLYPNESSYEARVEASKVFKVKPNQVMFDNGSASLLSIIFRAVINRGDTIAVPTPTFTLYEELAKIQGATLDKIKWLDNYKLPIKDLLESSAKMIIIVNPNAPTGTEVDFNDIEEVLEKSEKLVLLDEAYADFAQKSGINLLKKYENLIILRTFSKSQSLAGLRIGFALSSEQIIAELNKVRPTYNIDRLKQAAIKAVFKNWKVFNISTEKIIKQRKIAYKELTKRGFIIPSSKTNFLFVKIQKNSKKSALDYYNKLKDKKILVRYFGGTLQDVLRISIGSPEEMNELLRAIDEIK